MINYFLFELRMSLLKWQEVILPFTFFAIIMIMIPFTLPSEVGLLEKTSPAFIWISFLLSGFLSLERLFLDDIQDGFIDRYILFSFPLEYIFLIKASLFIILRVFPLIFSVFFFGVIFGLSLEYTLRLVIMLLITAPSLLFFGSFGSLLSVGNRNSGILIFILVFPLIIPAIIFGAGGCNLDIDLIQAVKLPLGFSLFSMVLTTMFSGFLYRQICEQR